MKIYKKWKTDAGVISKTVKSKNFTEFVMKNHPDPDNLMDLKTELAWDQICKLVEKYKKQWKK